MWNQLNEYLEKYNALTQAIKLLAWDIETEAPKDSIDNTSKILGLLSSEAYATLINPEVEHLLEAINPADLPAREAAIFHELRKQYKKLKVIPKQEYQAFTELTTKAQHVWAEARQKNDFAMFAPYLEEIVATHKRFIGYLGYTDHPYNTLLDDYEEGMTVAVLDDFFAEVKAAIVPLVETAVKGNEQLDDSFIFASYDVDKQRQFSRFIAEYLGFDYARGVIKESAHPFTEHMHNKDVRITSSYLENNISSGILSTIHETGHALYELGVADTWTATLVGEGTSMAMHESQSRFYENVIGRSLAFWQPLYPRLQAMFPEQLADVPVEAFWRAINKVQPSLIRTEADEVTYPLHIMVRYEIEKGLFDGSIAVKDLPQVWREKMLEYVGVAPSNDAEGVLQDIHWSGGSFGYFPSYALGSAYAAQLTAALDKVLDREDDVAQGTFKAINAYLTEHIYQYGKTKTAKQLLEAMCGEAFNPQYYTEYLRAKIADVYGK